MLNPLGARLAASVAIIGIAAFIAQVVEPLEEMLVDGATVEWAFGAPRLSAFAAVTAVGRRRPRGHRDAVPPATQMNAE